MNNGLTKSRGWKKYGTIIYAIATLLVITLVIIVLAYRDAQQAAINADRINASARLSSIAQDIKNGVYNIDLYAKEMIILQDHDQTSGSDPEMQALLQNVRTEQNYLEQATTTFTTTLGAFINGGELHGESGQRITISALEDDDNRRILRAIEEAWLPYERLISNFGASLEQDSLRIDAINYATDYARIFNDRISALSEQITGNLSQIAGAQSTNSQIFLTVGLIAALLVAAYLVLIAFRQLVKSDRALERSQRELNDIMETITEGLFLVDEDLRIGEQHSAELEKILRTKNIANRNFTELLEGRVSDKDIDLTEGFLEQLFNKNVYEELIEALNPLSRIQIYSQDHASDIYLSFTFHRVYEGKDIKNVLVSVRDITENVLLERRLEQERIENEAKMEMLSSILQVDADLMNTFLRHVYDSANSVNTVLRDNNYGSTLKNKLPPISRIIHSLKGEASALSLTSFTKQIEKLEDDIAVIRNKDQISGNDFLLLTVHLNELLTMNDKATYLFERIAEGRVSKEDVEGSADQNSTGQYLSRFADQVAERNGGKKVNISHSGLNDEKLDDTQIENVRELSLQLMRNAIVHGIELPLERSAIGKTEAGQINILLNLQDEGNWQYVFSDDGAGINFDKLRTMAAQDSQFIKNRDPKTLTRNDLIRFMFRSGTTTLSTPNEDGGRGVGMDVIREAIIRLQGKLQIHSETGQYTRFIVKFPKL